MTSQRMYRPAALINFLFDDPVFATEEHARLAGALMNYLTIEATYKNLNRVAREAMKKAEIRAFCEWQGELMEKELLRKVGRWR